MDLSRISKIEADKEYDWSDFKTTLQAHRLHLEIKYREFDSLEGAQRPARRQTTSTADPSSKPSTERSNSETGPVTSPQLVTPSPGIHPQICRKNIDDTLKTPTSCFRSISTRPNFHACSLASSLGMASIAVVVLDTVRKDVFDRHFDWLPGMRFENAWSSSHWTVPAHASLFTGKYGSEVGIHSKSPRFESSEPFLPELLQHNGYRMRSICANGMLYLAGFDRLFDNFKLIGPALKARENQFDWNEGLDRFASTGLLQYPLTLLNCLIDDSNTRESLETAWWLKMKGHDGASTALKQVQSWNFRDDEFLFLNLMEAHAPYQPPDEYKTVETPNVQPETILKGDVDLSAHKQAYEDEIRYLSDIYNDIFDQLHQDFDYIFTLSDHGELIGEYGIHGHFYGLHPELTHVPLVFSNGGSNEQSIDEPVSILDVPHTISNIAGINFESRGVDLRRGIPKRTCITEYHGLRKGRKNTCQDHGFPEEEINKYEEPLTGIAMHPSYYGYETVEGYHERGDAKAVNPQNELERMKDQLNNRSITEHGSLDLGDNVENALRNLGYM